MRRIALIGVPLVLLGALAFFLQRSNDRSRGLLEERFEGRVETATTFIEGFIADKRRIEQRIGLQQFSGTPPDAATFGSVMDAAGFEAAVLLDSSGRLLQVFPERNDILGSNIATQYEHLSKAVAGETWVSDVVPSAARGIPVVAIAVPYETPSGRRVLSGAFSIEDGSLSVFLKNVVPLRSSEVYLVDRQNNVIVGSRPVANVGKLDEREPDLGRAVAAGPRDGEVFVYTKRGESRLAVKRPVGTTGWVAIASAPEAVVFEPIKGARTSLWTVFAFIVVAVMLLVILLDHIDRARRLLDVRLAEQTRLNAALSDFSSRAAHDLRAPLTTMTTAVEILRRPDLAPDVRGRVLETLESQTRQSATLIEELLELARASGTPKRERIDARTVADEVARDFSEVELEANELPELDVDPVSFRQALRNLMVNASLYGRGVGKRALVSISMSQTSEGPVIAVADRGPGLPEGVSDNIFKPFERGKGHDLPGTGLGLAIVGAMAEAHGGRVWYEDRDGGGAVFKILIPGAV